MTRQGQGFAAFVLFVFLWLSGCSFDQQPTHLSNTRETIIVAYINWACDCPDWIETKYRRDSIEIDEDLCIYIEPAEPALAVPDSFYTNGQFFQTLRLSGRFYLDKGIPVCYQAKSTGKTAPGKVFYYDRIELIDQ